MTASALPSLRSRARRHVPRFVVAGLTAAVAAALGDGSCWDGYFTEKRCCDSLYGPKGNKGCWDGVKFTFERCCPQEIVPVASEWFRCVPRSSLVRAAVATAVLLVCAACCPAEAMATRGEELARGRSPFLDNAKFLTMVTVVWVHLLDRTLGEGSRPVSAIIKVTGFQMPVFSLVSGTVSSRGPLLRRHLEHLVVHLVMPLIFYVLLLYPLLDLPLAHLYGEAMQADPRQGLQWTYQDVWSALLMVNRYDLGWYLRCLIIWRLCCPLLDLFALRVQAVIVTVFGITGAYSQVWGLNALVLGVPSAATSLLPFFWLGRQLDLERLVLMAPRPRWGAGWAALLGLLALYAVFEDVGDLVLGREVRTGYRGLLAENCPADRYFLWARFVVEKALHVAISAFFLAFCVPRSRTFFSDHGRHTIYPYLLHTLLLVHPLGSLAWTLQGSRAQLNALTLLGWGLALACLLVSLAATFILSSEPLRRCFRWALEPYWVLPSRSAPMSSPPREGNKDE